MSNDKPFQPEFGPNGAVMNAPTMTPEMPAKFEEAAKPLSARRVAREFSHFGALGLAVVAILALWPTLQSFSQSSPWAAGFLSGLFVSLMAAYLVFMIYRLLVQWESIGRSAVVRVLVLPDWARWSLVASGALAGLGQILLSATFAVSIWNMAEMPVVYLMWAVAIAASVIGVAITMLLLALGRKVGWVMSAA